MLVFIVISAVIEVEYTRLCLLNVFSYGTALHHVQNNLLKKSRNTLLPLNFSPGDWILRVIDRFGPNQDSILCDVTTAGSTDQSALGRGVTLPCVVGLNSTVFVF